MRAMFLRHVSLQDGDRDPVRTFDLRQSSHAVLLDGRNFLPTCRAALTCAVDGARRVGDAVVDSGAISALGGTKMGRGS